jgi:hypothetical protein
MSSANQRYKMSGTSKPFKEWLVEQQKEGQLEVHDENTYRNAVGNAPTMSEIGDKRKRNLMIAFGVALAIYGIYKLSKSGKLEGAEASL